jgi:hypothetical protein
MNDEVLLRVRGSHSQLTEYVRCISKQSRTIDEDQVERTATTLVDLFAVVLAKSKKAESSYRAALSEIVLASDRERVRYLTPEEIPGFIASLAVPPEPSERMVKGYRVKGAFTQTSAADAQARQEALARLIAKSLKT